MQHTSCIYYKCVDQLVRNRKSSLGQNSRRKERKKEKREQRTKEKRPKAFKRNHIRKVSNKQVDFYTFLHKLIALYGIEEKHVANIINSGILIQFQSNGIGLVLQSNIRILLSFSASMLFCEILGHTLFINVVYMVTE